MCLSHLASNCSDERFYRRRGIEGVFHNYYMRSKICPAPCWRNKSISLMSPSDDDPYLTSVWMLLLRLARGRPYFIMVAVIT